MGSRPRSRSKTEIITFDPLRRLQLRVAIFLLLLGALAGAYLLGRTSTETPCELGVGSMVQTETVEALRRELLSAQLELELERRSQDMVRQEVVELRDTLAIKDRQIRRYRATVASGGNVELSLGEFKLKQQSQSNHFKLSVDVRRLAQKDKASYFEGEMVIMLHGHEDAAAKQINVTQLSDDFGESIKLRFKHFQTVAGRVTLPDGFVPQLCEIQVVSPDGEVELVSNSWSWNPEKEN